MIDRSEVKMLKIPVTCGCGKRYLILQGLFSQSIFKFLQELSKVLSVIGLATTIIGTRIFLQCIKCAFELDNVLIARAGNKKGMC